MRSAAARRCPPPGCRGCSRRPSLCSRSVRWHWLSSPAARRTYEVRNHLFAVERSQVVARTSRYLALTAVVLVSAAPAYAGSSQAPGLLKKQQTTTDTTAPTPAPTQPAVAPAPAQTAPVKAHGNAPTTTKGSIKRASAKKQAAAPVVAP